MAACAALLAAAGACAEDPPGDAGYTLGSGLQIPGTGFTLGGYGTLSYDRPNDATARANLDNASLFVWWEGDSRWKFFTEIEFENFARTREATGGKDDY